MTHETQNPIGDHGPSAATNVIHTVLRFLSLLRRRRSFLIAAVASCLLFGFVYFIGSARIYRAKAQILVRQSQPDSSSVKMVGDRSTQEQMATFERILTSTVVLERALAQLDRLPPEIPRTSTLEQAIDELRDLLYAKAIRRTSIIELTCRSEDPDSTVSIVNAVVASYLQYMDENHKSVSAEAVTMLKRERTELETELLQKEQQLVLKKHATADLGLDGDSGYVHPSIQNVITLNDAVLQSRQRRFELQATLAALEQTVQNGGDLRQHMMALEPLIGRELLLSAVGMNPQDTVVMSELEESNVENQGKLRALQVHYGPNHFKIIELQETIAAASNYAKAFKARLQERASGMRSAELGQMLLTLVREDLAGTEAQEKRLLAEYGYSQADAKNLITSRSEITIMERDLESLRELKSALINRIGNIEINESQADVRVSIVSHPSRPTEPVSPELPKVVLFSLLMGTMVGTGIIYILDAIDDKFRSPEELQEQLGLPVLAMIRKHEIREGIGLPTLLVHHSPNAGPSEAFRTLRTTLAFSGHECSRLVISSSEPSDGKTTVLANLGVSSTQSGKRTLLIDCDLRRPGLTNLFDLRRSEGVAELLRSTDDVGTQAQGYVVNSGMPGLDVLASGRRPPDPAELLSRMRFEELIAWAETEYDQILIDSPPVLAAADASIIGRNVDGMVVVIQPQKNHRRSVIRAFESLYRMGINVMGVVVNAIDHEQDDYGAYGGYGYGYGAGYGDDETGEQLESAPPLPSYDRPAARPSRPSRQPAAAPAAAARTATVATVPMQTPSLPPMNPEFQTARPAPTQAPAPTPTPAPNVAVAAGSATAVADPPATIPLPSAVTRATTQQAAQPSPPDVHIPEKLNEGGAVTIRRRAS